MIGQGAGLLQEKFGFRIFSDTMETIMEDTEQGLRADIAEHLKKVYSLEPAQIEQMIHLSVTSLTDSFVWAVQALAENDLTEVSAAAHKIKGILLGVGVKKSADQAFAIERAARNGDSAAYQDMLQELQDGLAELVKN
jgi:HPt (histidine-containing phosphotransfer) domain-containing protein